MLSILFIVPIRIAASPAKNRAGSKEENSTFPETTTRPVNYRFSKRTDTPVLYIVLELCFIAFFALRLRTSRSAAGCRRRKSVAKIDRRYRMLTLLQIAYRSIHFRPDRKRVYLFGKFLCPAWARRSFIGTTFEIDRYPDRYKCFLRLYFERIFLFFFFSRSPYALNIASLRSCLFVSNFDFFFINFGRFELLISRRIARVKVRDSGTAAENGRVDRSR